MSEALDRQAAFGRKLSRVAKKSFRQVLLL